MKKITSAVLAVLMLATLALTGCSKNDSPLDPKAPTTITMWHNYGGEMLNAMTLLIDEFNAGIGKDKGIIVRVDAVSSSSELAKNLDMILDENPTAPEMPNITVCYPKTAVKFARKGLIADLTAYFTPEKTALYVDEFISEGMLDESLYVFPFAKSTEVLFVNRTLFDRFSAATGVGIESLSTFEGICEASVKYHDWCGKSFFTADSWFNIFSVTGDQANDPFIADEQLNTDSATYKKLLDAFSRAVENGGVRIYDGYSSDLAQTGDIVCSTGSTAGILFYGSAVKYPDNTTENVDYTILPYPTVSGGEKIALQRGNGMIVKRATEAEEYASSLLLEWLTAPEQNLRFISNTGYLPVTKEAFNGILNGNMPEITNINISKLLTTAVAMQKSYTFCIPKAYDAFDLQSKNFEAEFKASLGSLAPAD